MNRPAFEARNGSMGLDDGKNLNREFPGNPDGTPLVGEKELASMNKNTVLINTARASLVDEEALIEALAEHRIYGYGTDVFKGEPHINEKFENLDNVVLSPAYCCSKCRGNQSDDQYSCRSHFRVFRC